MQIETARLRTGKPNPLHVVMAICVAAVLVAGCDRPESPIAGPDEAAPRLSRFLTGNAATSLDAQGRFSLSEPSAPGNRPIITAERAGELALSYVRSFGPSLKGAWEEERGAPIDINTLRADGRILYATTPYGAFPSGFHPGFETAFGPYYLVPLTSGGKPVLLVSVAAYNTRTSIDRRGFIERPLYRGNEFVSRGIPVDSTRFRLVSPEEAVTYVGRVTGARISRTPELVRMALPHAPASALWKLTIDREVEVRAGPDGARARVREIYVGADRENRLMMSTPRNERFQPFPALRIENGRERNEIAQVPVLDGAPVSFEPVVIDEGGV